MLAAIGVIFIPVLLQRPADYEVDVASQIPEQPEFTFIEFHDPQPPAGVEPPPSEAELFIPDDSEPLAVAGESEGDDGGDLPVSEAEPAASNEPSASAQPDVEAIVAGLDEQGLPQAWVVQVASFKDLARAQSLVNELKTKQFRAYLRSVKQIEPTMHRVYVGPSINRKDAEALKRTLDDQLNLETLLLRFAP